MPDRPPPERRRLLEPLIAVDMGDDDPPPLVPRSVVWGSIAGFLVGLLMALVAVVGA